MTMEAAATAKEIFRYSSCDRGDVSFAAPISASRRGNAFSGSDFRHEAFFLLPPSASRRGNAFSGSDFRLEAFFLLPPSAAANGNGEKRRRDDGTEGAFSEKVGLLYPKFPKFEGVLDERVKRIVTLLQEACSGMDAESTKFDHALDAGSSHRDPYFNECADTDDLKGECAAQTYRPKLSPINCSKENCDQLGLHATRSSKQDVDETYTSKTSPLTLYEHKQRLPTIDAQKHDHEKRQIQNRNKARHKDSSLLHSQKDSQKVIDVVFLGDENVQPDEPIDDKWDKSKICSHVNRDDPEAVELTRSDIKCLDAGVYLSSPLINYYIAYIKRATLCYGGDKFYIFNTHFYRKLQDVFCGKGTFLKLRRWWQGVNIFQRAYIVLPIHGMSHWSVIIVCMPAKESNSGPILLHLDSSLGIHSSGTIFDTVERYLVEEWHHLRNSPPFDASISDTIWKDHLGNMQKEVVEVPRQNNGYDCGIFMLYYIIRFIYEAPERFTRDDLDMFSRTWFRSEDASNLRSTIREVLIKEFENASLGRSF